VLKALLAGGGAEPVSADAVSSAVEAAVRSPEVDVALSNIAAVHLPAGAVGALDRLAVVGRPGRDARAAVSEGVLRTLTEAGLVALDGKRYVLRLGLWGPWRLARPEGASRHHSLSRYGRGLTRLVGGRAVRASLLTSVILLVLVLAFGSAFLIPGRTFTAQGCGGGSGLRVRVSHPAYVSTGDEYQLEVQVQNDGGSPGPVDGNVVVWFPASAAGPVNLNSNNAITFGRLRPGEEQKLVVSFTHAQPGRLLPDTSSTIPVELRLSAAGVDCPSQRLSMAVAPIPRLKALQRAASVLVLAFLVPLTVEVLLRRHGGRQPPTAGDRPPVPAGGRAAGR
jgi:hypothetical protein